MKGSSIAVLTELTMSSSALTGDRTGLDVDRLV